MPAKNPVKRAGHNVLNGIARSPRALGRVLRKEIGAAVYEIPDPILTCPNFMYQKL
jgi:hypothetical protein